MLRRVATTRCSKSGSRPARSTTSCRSCGIVWNRVESGGIVGELQSGFSHVGGYASTQQVASELLNFLVDAHCFVCFGWVNSTIQTHVPVYMPTHRITVRFEYPTATYQLQHAPQARVSVAEEKSMQRLVRQLNTPLPNAKNISVEKVV